MLRLGNLARLALMAAPGIRGTFRAQADELFSQVRCIVGRQPVPLTPTTLMVFLRDRADEAEARELVRAHFGAEAPVTTCVTQPPCDGSALAIELWAMGGAGVRAQRYGEDLLAVEAEGIRWIYAGGVEAVNAGSGNAHDESRAVLERLQRRLGDAGVAFDHVVRTWIYVNQITAGVDGTQRYQEFNRARAEFYREIPFGRALRPPFPGAPGPRYPASTGIGTADERICCASVALATERRDVFVVPLENPSQTPAYDYASGFSPHAPKFSRAMVVVQGGFASVLVSGTASIVEAATVFPGDVVRQTEQTLDNIERLIARENAARQGLPGFGATLRDVAKLRVYLKRTGDYEVCRAVVERRLPRVPALYLHADVCRPDLLVEIEAIAFAPYELR